ncbi:MAG: NADPH-dependent FMN reductase [Thalassobius sp.]|nr:NADPH-dependent FMN reductase [Thalassovita sp.]
MKVLLFNGSMDRNQHATSYKLIEYFKNSLESEGIEVITFNLGEAAIPLFDPAINPHPASVLEMNKLFLEADAHIWFTPLYHGSMTGVMKNCLDWLELSAKAPIPYLTNKVIGMVCWAYGEQAMQGINAMDAVAKALRAWPLPFSVPITRKDLFDTTSGEITEFYKTKFKLLKELLISHKVTFI